MGSCFGYRTAAEDTAAEDIPAEDTLAGDNPVEDNPEEDNLGERIVEAGLQQAVLLDCSNSSFKLFLNLLRAVDVQLERRAEIAKMECDSFAWTCTS